MAEMIERYGMWACRSGWSALQRREYNADQSAWKTNNNEAVKHLAHVNAPRTQELTNAITARARSRRNLPE